jgi:23S rRNA (pseudouridine1915-N3)-methyltransferase
MIHIIHISDGEKHFSEAVSEYLKRLGKNIEIHTIKPIKHTEIEFIKREETKKLTWKLQKLKWTIYLCDERGEDMNSVEMSELHYLGRNKSESTIYIIGWSYGVDIELLRASHSLKLLKLGSFVMPHGLAYLVLVEQIYRSLEIIKWSGYHHN